MRRGGRLLAAVVGLAIIQPARPPPYSQVNPTHPVVPAPGAMFTLLLGVPALDLSRYRLSFEDRFEALDITADGGKGRWFAPVHSDFGAARFLPPGPDGPFLKTSLAGGRPMLTLRAQRGPQGWTGALMQSVDGRGRGFAQAYGYFELRAKLPGGAGTWPAFWLLTRDAYSDPSRMRGEIDVMEEYGLRPGRLHLAVHLWPAYADNSGGVAGPWTLSRRVDRLGLAQGFHRYGAAIDPRWVTFYLDGEPIGRYPTLPTYRGPLYMLVDLAMHKRGLDQARSPADLVVDYVRAYAPR